MSRVIEARTKSTPTATRDDIKDVTIFIVHNLFKRNEGEYH